MHHTATEAIRYSKLTAQGIMEIESDAEVCSLYLDFLALIDDLLCEFVEDREPPRQSAEDTVRCITQIQSKIAILNANTVQENIATNFETAQRLRSKALEGIDVGISINTFLAGLHLHYRWITEN